MKFLLKQSSSFFIFKICFENAIPLFALIANFDSWLGVTQFESTGARRAFPCLDEPLYKSRFTLHIAKEPLRDVTANMPVAASNRPV